MNTYEAQRLAAIEALDAARAELEAAVAAQADANLAVELATIKLDAANDCLMAVRHAQCDFETRDMEA